ncbi:MAG: branched-chain amino acid aminotransferase [Bacteriovoracales bacterium]
MSFKIDPRAIDSLKSFVLPEKIGFGTCMSPIMFQSCYKDGAWGQLEMVPFGPLSILPTSKVLHYGQEIFEGLKAYRVDNQGPFLFRHRENFLRFNKSAERMAIPTLPEEIFMDAVEGIAAYGVNTIPTKTGTSLYIRPFTIATEESLGIRPSLEYKFLVVASPSESYFQNPSVNVFIERNLSRAVKGGTGTAKTGGNYAASLYTTLKAQKLGYNNTVWLDAETHTHIEEMSGMNFFAVIEGKLVTPKLTDTILDGITRKSIIELAKIEGIPCKEETIPINSLIGAIKEKRCTEVFACGTASIIAPISSLGEEDGTIYKLTDSEGNISNKLKDLILSIQEGRKEGPKGWVKKVEPKYLEKIPRQ